MAENITIQGSSILQAFQASGVETVVTVPDLWTSDAVLRPLPSRPGLRHIKVCKEDEGFGICAGLVACGKRAVVAMQYTGLLDSINALRVVGVEFRQPVCMLVGLMFKEPDIAPTQSKLYGVKIIQPILDAMGVRHCVLETEDDVPNIAVAIGRAYTESAPTALLVGRSPTP